MSRTFIQAKALVVLWLATTAGSTLAAPRAEALDLDDKERAQLSKEIIKQKRTGNADKRAARDGSCGSVDIGNDSQDKKGSSRLTERQRTVIVTGNVYNTANCRR